MSRWTDFPAQIPKGMRAETMEQGNISCEWLTPEGAGDGVIYYTHGGGFVLPLYNALKNVTIRLADMTKRRVFLVHYRLAPENPFPAAVDDCVAAWRWLISEGGVDPKQAIIMGESAGGNLCVATTLALRDSGQPLPASIASISPVYDLGDPRDPATTPDDPMVDPGFMNKQFAAYLNGVDARHPLASPVYADLRGLPPLLIQTGEIELLRPDAERLAARALEAGVDVTLEVWPGMWHFWHIFYNVLPEAGAALESIKAFVDRQA